MAIPCHELDACSEGAYSTLFYNCISHLRFFYSFYTKSIQSYANCIPSNERPGAHFKFQLRGGALIGTRALNRGGGGKGGLI